MTWTIEWDKRAVRELKKLSKPVQRDILNYLKKVAEQSDPRRFGKPLRHDLKGLWRYRVAATYRLVCQLEDEHCIILVLRAAHQRQVYV